eukprot:SAG11_NODE_1575_length_4659_cov_2.048904_9_plen_60_part_00
MHRFASSRCGSDFHWQGIEFYTQCKTVTSKWSAPTDADGGAQVNMPILGQTKASPASPT